MKFKILGRYTIPERAFGRNVTYCIFYF